jgi:alkaline phosphatase
MLSVKTISIRLLVVSVIFAIWMPLSALAAGPKNVIFYIGDGMASAQRRIAEEVHGYKLTMNQFPVIGLYTTFSSDSIIPDSAAAGTAMATGHKSASYVISMDVEKKIAFETLAEAAKKLGKSVGILTTTRLTHATPATFSAHIENRNSENKIAEQYLEKKFDVWMGGGRRHFIPKSADNRQEPDKSLKSKRKDERDLLKEFAGKGYAVLRTKNELMALDIKSDTRVFAAFTESHLPYKLDMPAKVPNLAEMTAVAIKILKQNPKGFFLMVEGGKIDHAAHANAPVAMVCDTMDLDNAVKAGVDFRQEDSDTLILVGGDHETGGLGMGTGSDYYMKPKMIKDATKTEFGMGYGEVLQDPDKAFEIFQSATGIKRLRSKEKKAIKKAIKQAKAGKPMRSPNISYNPSIFGYTFAQIVSNRTRIGWTSYAHTAHPVLLTVVGPGAENFMGYYDNTDIGKKIAALWEVELSTWQMTE